MRLATRYTPTSPRLSLASPGIKPDWHSQSIIPAAWWTMDVGEKPGARLSEATPVL